MIKETLVCLGLTMFAAIIPSEKRYPRCGRRKLDSCLLMVETPRERIKYPKLPLVSEFSSTIPQQEINYSPKEDSKK